ncbi:MAG: hypothetical protein F6K14_07740 [Symploca sp. SIO2C1]|nr:hypothetical protein [Symploca sp. SIO2C1]
MAADGLGLMPIQLYSTLQLNELHLTSAFCLLPPDLKVGSGRGEWPFAPTFMHGGEKFFMGIAFKHKASVRLS